MMTQKSRVKLNADIEIRQCKYADLTKYRNQVQDSQNKVFLLYVAPRFIIGNYYYYLIGKHKDGHVIEGEVAKLAGPEITEINNIIDYATFDKISAENYGRKDDLFEHLNNLFGHAEYQRVEVQGNRHAMQIDSGKESIDIYLKGFTDKIISGLSDEEFTAGFNYLAEKMPEFCQKALALPGMQKERSSVGTLLHAQLLSPIDNPDRLKLILSKSLKGAHSAPVNFEDAGAMYPIRLALDKWKIQEAAALVVAGASCDATFLVSDERQSHQALLRHYANKEGFTQNDQQAISFLIERGADVNPPAAISEIQAVAFADHQHNGVFTWPFLTKPANQLNDTEKGLLQDAGKHYCVPVVGILFAKSKFDLVSQILQKKPDLIYMTYPLAHERRGLTMLEVAVMIENSDAVKMLLEFCSDDNSKFLLAKCLEIIAEWKKLNKPEVMVQLLLKANSLGAQIKAQGNSTTYNQFVEAVLNLKQTFAAVAKFINDNIAAWKKADQNLQEISIYQAINSVIQNIDVQDSNEVMNLQYNYGKNIAKMKENIDIVKGNVSLALSRVPYNLVFGILESYFPAHIQDLGTRFVFEAVKSLSQCKIERKVESLEPVAAAAPVNQPPSLPPQLLLLLLIKPQ